MVFPATHYVAGDERMRRAVERIEAELQERLAWFEANGKLLEAQRLRMRTQYDLEMIQEVGYCNGIENYSMPIDGRTYGEPPFTLLDYFPDDFLLVIDESHVAVPQLHGQYEGDRSRKDVLVEHGFRLPSGRDNRPLRFEEVMERVNQVVFLSATPADYELRMSDAGRRADRAAHRPGRPRGHREAHQGPDRRPHGADQRAGREGRPGARHHAHQEDGRGPHRLPARARACGCATSTARSTPSSASRSCAPCASASSTCSSASTCCGRASTCPRCSLVAILDADKEGFLRIETTLIQTMGRAARNVDGQVIMYADKVTDSMQRAISETNRRRRLQEDYNAEHGIDPQTIRKAVTDILSMLRPDDGRRCPAGTGATAPGISGGSPAELAELPQHELAGSSRRSRRRCTRPRPTCASSTRPACATRSRT